MQEKHSHFITINAHSNAHFEYPFLPVFEVLSGKSEKSRLKKAYHKKLLLVHLWKRRCPVLFLGDR